MRNCVITILGQKGAGKTTLSRYFLARTPRAIVVDRFLEYDGGTAARLEPAVDYLATNWRSNFKLVCRFTDELHYRELFRFIDVTAQRCPTLPISLTIEEVDFFARTQSIEPSLSNLYNYGRHWDVNLLAIARMDSQIHRLVIHSSDVLVVMRTRKFTADMRERFSQQQLQQLVRLEQLIPGTEPVKGKHYLTYPEEDDPVAAWLSCQAPLAGMPGAR